MITLILPLTSKQKSLREIIDKLKALQPFNINLLVLCEKKHKIVEEFEDFKKFTDKKFEAEQVGISLEKNSKTKVSKKKNQEKINISLNIFPNGTKEESMINTSIKDLPECGFVLIRNDVKDININLIEKILLECQSGADIIMAKKPRKKNFITNFFSKIFQKLCSFIFHFSFYSGDIGVQYFNNLALSIMKETNALMLTKINKWLAINIKYIDFNVETTYIKEKSYGNNKLMLGIFIFSFMLSIGLIVFFSFNSNISFIFYFLVAFLLLIFAILIMLTAFRIYLINKLGDIRAENVSIILRREIWITLKNLQKI
ncbi:MAG: hypothetical protein PHR96_04945 [Clostridia bacterium]|nr:hypothetical protein [Clostridia bacterium]